jgi:hypothetical protein
MSVLTMSIITVAIIAFSLFYIWGIKDIIRERRLMRQWEQQGKEAGLWIHS